MHKYLLLLGLLISSLTSRAECTCDFILPMTFESTAGVPIIFYGEVKEVDSDCNEESLITFDIIELYKGNLSKVQEAYYQCGTECGMSFAPGERWIVYSTINNAQYPVLDWCSRTRREFLSEVTDFYEGVLFTSFQEELRFLRSNFEANKNFHAGLKERQYKKVPVNYIPWLLGISALFMIIGYLLFGKK